MLASEQEDRTLKRKNNDYAVNVSGQSSRHFRIEICIFLPQDTCFYINTYLLNKK